MITVPLATRQQQCARLATLHVLVTNFDKYDHDAYIQADGSRCALGIAVLFRETHFPDMPVKEGYGRMIVSVDDADPYWEAETIDAYFGSGAWQYIFSLVAPGTDSIGTCGSKADVLHNIICKIRELCPTATTAPAEACTPTTEPDSRS